MQPALSVAVDHAAAWYRECHFWPVRVVEDAVLLPLGRGVVAFDVPADHAVRVQKVLERNDNHTAAMFVKLPDPRVTFLAEADESVFGQFQMPFDVQYLTVPVALRLPLLSASPPDGRKWIHAPNPARRWFPRAAAILAVITAETPYALRPYRARAKAAGRERILIG